MPKTILVADDKASVRNLVREYLEVEGFRVIIASNGREALYAVRAGKTRPHFARHHDAGNERL